MARQWGAELVGQHGRMLRSDGRWYHVEVLAVEERDSKVLHRIRFYSRGAPTSSEVVYDLREPSRRLRWVDARGALLPEGASPVADARGVLPAAAEDDESRADVGAGAGAGAGERGRSSSNSNTVQVVALGSAAPRGSAAAATQPHVAVSRPSVDTSSSVSVASSASASTPTPQLRAARGVVYVEPSGRAFALAPPPAADGAVVRVFLPVLLNRRRMPAPLQPPPGGWRALQAQAADPLRLLYRRVRILWPVDNEWFGGRVMNYDAGSKQHFVRYDDGEEQWYAMGRRDYYVDAECGDECVGQLAIVLCKVPAASPAESPAAAPLQLSAVAASGEGQPSALAPSEAPAATDGSLGAASGTLVAPVSAATLKPGGASASERVVASVLVPRWRLVRICGYDAELDMHLLRFQRGKGPDAPEYDVEEPPASAQRGRERADDGLLDAPETFDGGDEELTSLHLRPFHLLVDPARLPAGERIVGRRVLVYSSGSLLSPGTVTDFGAPTASAQAAVTAAVALTSPLSRHDPKALEPTAAAPAAAAPAEGFAPLSSAPLDFKADLKICFDDGRRLCAPLDRLAFCFGQEERVPGAPRQRGAVGLINMGNTCYLNSVLQSLSHIDALTRFFFDAPALAARLNTANRLGMQGRLALSFAELLQGLWGEDMVAFAPSFVKAMLSEKNSTFNGMGQQDAHEALMCLLDGLHEDLAEPDVAASTASQLDAENAAKEEEREKDQKRRAEGSAERGKGRGGLWGWAATGRGTAATEVVAVGSEPAAPAPKVESSVHRPQRQYTETTSIVKRLFFMQTQVEFVCQRHPRHVQRRHGPRGGEMLPPLPLALPREVHEGWLRRRVFVDPVLTDCLNNVFGPEPVERKCDGCGRVVPMTSRLMLSSLPPVLVIQLKRFEFKEMRQPGSTAPTYENVKMKDCIPFPLYGLDMAPFLAGGRGAGGGNTASGGGGQGAVSASGAAAADAAPRTSPLSASSGGLSFDADAPGRSAGSSASSAPGAAAELGSLYDLFAVVCHTGTAERGHYTAFSRNFGCGDWYYFDDSIVVTAREDEVSSEYVASLAYLLFYTRRERGAQAPKQSEAALARERAWRLKHPPQPAGSSGSSGGSAGSGGSGVGGGGGGGGAYGAGAGVGVAGPLPITGAIASLFGLGGGREQHANAASRRGAHDGMSMGAGAPPDERARSLDRERQSQLATDNAIALALSSVHGGLP